MKNRILALSVCLSLSGQTIAQCVDWAPGFGPTQNGFDNHVDFVGVLDNGTGPFLYATGGFETAGGVEAHRVARWTGSGWIPVEGGPTGFEACAQFDDGTGPAAYLGGAFLDGVAGSPHMVRWNASGLSGVGAGTNGNVTALAVFDDGSGSALYVGGSFTEAGGRSAAGIARWRAGAWSPVMSSTAGPRQGHAMAYDSARQRTVVFGGTLLASGYSAANTWEWDGTEWIKKTIAGPPARANVTMAYDSARGRMVLYGGGGGSQGAQNDTWEYDGTVWVQRAINGPPGRFNAGMAYDSTRGRVVVFGGFSDSTHVRGDTWEYNGTVWTLAATTGPAARAGTAMAFDSVRGRTVLYGGYSPTLGTLGDTWEWDGSAWTVVAAAAPPARYYHAMTFDSARGCTVMVGGISGPGPFDPGTWEWDGTTWTLAASGEPADRGLTAIAFDSAAGKTVLFGGGNSLGDTWVWGGQQWEALSGGMNNAVNALCVFNDGTGPALYAGGHFTQAGGAPARGVARWNGTSWSVVGLNTTQSPGIPVNALAVHNDGSGAALYAGGVFDTTRWNGADWLTVGPDAPIAGVHSFATFNDGNGSALYVGGTFLEGSGRGLISRWNGTAWAWPDSALLGTLARSLTSFDDGHGPALWVGGTFANAAGKPSGNFAKWGVPCSGPVILIQPADTAAVFNQAIQLSVTATGTETLTYQWRKDGVDLVESAQVYGATSATLSLNWWSFGDAGSYDVVVSNAIDTVTSQAAIVSIPFVGQGGPIRVNPILIPPQPVPGLPAGNQYLGFAGPQLAQTGEVAFTGYINGVQGSGGLTSVNLWRNEVVTLVAMANDAPPGTGNDVRFANALTSWVAATSGQLAISADLTGAAVQSSNNKGIWYRNDSSFVLAARKGNQAAGYPPGAIYTELTLGRMSDSGRIVFTGRADGAGFQQTLSAWVWDAAAGGSLLARLGQQAPGTTANYSNFSAFEISPQGVVAFSAGLSNGKTGLWVGQPGVLQLGLITGAAAPGFATGSTISGIFELKMSPTGIVAGRVMVNTPSGIRWAIYQVDGQTVTPVITSGEQVPGTLDATYFASVPHVSNALGAIVFSSNMANGGSGPSEGISFRDAEGLATIAVNHGDPPPGVPAGLNYFRLNVLSGSGPVATLNYNNHVVFGCELSSGYSAVFGWTRATGLFPIAVPGTQLEVVGGVFRTVQNARISTIGGSSTPDSNNLNDASQVVLAVGFTDGVQGIYSGSFGSFVGGFIVTPIILVPPQSQVVPAGSQVTFRVDASGARPLSYQWRRNLLPISNGAGVSGVNTATLQISAAGQANVGSYDVVVSNSHGTATSSTATLTVLCYPNCDGSTTNPLLTANDFQCFLNKFAAADPYANCDQSTSPPILNANDFQCFLNRYAAGCH